MPLKNKYNTTLELFASPFNTYLSNYCSLFYDIEKYFNSAGNFNDIDLSEGFYVANPPFDEDIMKIAVNKIINSLSKSNKPLTFLIVLPAWDNNNYGKFDALDKIKNSSYLKYIRLINKDESSFINYSTSKILNLCSIYLIILQNNYNFYTLKNNELDLLVNNYWINSVKKRKIYNIKKSLY